MQASKTAKDDEAMFKAKASDKVIKGNTIASENYSKGLEDEEEYNIARM
jgi:hypothetical protein